MIKVAVTKPGAVTEERETRIGAQDIFMTGSEFIHLNSGGNEVNISCPFSSLVHQHTAQEVLRDVSRQETDCTYVKLALWSHCKIDAVQMFRLKLTLYKDIRHLS